MYVERMLKYLDFIMHSCTAVLQPRKGKKATPQNHISCFKRSLTAAVMQMPHDLSFLTERRMQ